LNKLSQNDRDLAATVLRHALTDVPHLRCDVAPRADADVEISRDGCPTIRVRLRPWSSGGELDGDEVWLLRTASAARQQQLRGRNENFVALNGAVRLVRDWLVVDRTGLPAARRSVPVSRPTDPFSDRNSLIARTLLANAERTWSVRDLAAHAGVSLGTASQVVRALVGTGAVSHWQQGRTARIRLTEPERLLHLWRAAYSWERNPALAFHAPIGDVSRFVRRLPALMGDTRWALTLQAGAAQVAPHAAWDRVHIYVGVDRAGDLLPTGEAHGWEPAVDGRVVLMKPYYRTAVWHDLQTVRQLPVVSTLQLALDLWDYPLRGREQAEHLLRTVLHADV
jgi:hypothetical protein